MRLEGDALAAWLAERAGCLNASRACDAFDRLKKGGWAKARADYMREILAERLTGHTTRQYVTPEMEWGLEHEAAAIAAYEAHTGVLVRSNGESLRHPLLHFCRATPDAFVDPDGQLQVKCPTTTKHLLWIQQRIVPEEHRPQMLIELAVTGRRWCDFASFDPRVKQTPLRLFVMRFEPDQAEIAAAESMAGEFLAEVEIAWDLLTTAAA